MPGQEIEQKFYCGLRGSRKRFPRVGRGAPFWGHVEELTLETASEVPAKHFFSETLLLPGTGIAKMPPERLCWPILGLCWPIWGPCWGHVRPSWGYVGAMLPHLGLLLDHVVGDVGPSGTPWR